MPSYSALCEQLNGKTTCLLNILIDSGLIVDFDFSFSSFIYPFKVKWLLTENAQNTGGTAVVWVIPKRNIKQAVHRNTLRRRCREAYRLNKYLLPTIADKKGIHLALVCVAKEEVSFRKIEKSTIRVLQKISQLITA